jgi:hypothetical protein
LIVGLNLFSCEKSIKTNSITRTPAQHNLNSLLQARLSGLTFEESIDKYYSNPILKLQENKYDSLHYLITQKYSNRMVDLIMQKEDVRFVWNEKLLTAKIWKDDELSELTIDWVFDTVDCAESFFLSEGERLNQNGHYYCICFDSLGLIKSMVPLLNSQTMETDWF